MDFKYNGNLLEEDRINLVAKEIINKYSEISFEKAKEAAMLEGRISDSIINIDELNRLYNIMLVNCDNKSLVSIIYKDFLEVLNKKSLEDNKYFDLVNGINDYLQNCAEFPIINDYE